MGTARDEVLPRYQALFARDKLPELTAEQFRSFLSFKNNRHWKALDRLGPAICEDMPRLRKALDLLLDESKPIRARLNQLIPRRAQAYVPRLGKAVLTPILLISYPTKYGVWNQVSEGAMKTLKIWPDPEAGEGLGDRYEKVNSVLLDTSRELGVDLWTLDALWWRVENEIDTAGGPGPILGPGPDGDAEQRFGLERHLQEFLRDNWEKTTLSKDWKLYEEDGEQVGFEYRTEIGRIDLLAKHKSEPRWLVIELKRDQSSDHTVGQALRYMGWVKRRLAKAGESVEGLVIARTADEALSYALYAAPTVGLNLYEVQFRLLAPKAHD